MDKWPEELPYITNVLTNGANRIEMPERTPYTSKYLTDVLQTVDKHLILKVMEVYKDDYEMFGFPYPDPLLLELTQ